MSQAQERLKGFLRSLPGPTARKCEAFAIRVRTTNRLGQVALRRGLITRKQLGEALEMQSHLRGLGRAERIGQILVRRKALTRRKLEALLA